MSLCRFTRPLPSQRPKATSRPPRRPARANSMSAPEETLQTAQGPPIQIGTANFIIIHHISSYLFIFIHISSMFFFDSTRFKVPQSVPPLNAAGSGQGPLRPLSCGPLKCTRLRCEKSSPRQRWANDPRCSIPQAGSKGPLLHA